MRLSPIRHFSLIAALIAAIQMVSSADTVAAADQKASLPSPEGSTIAKVRAMPPGSWLDLGAPDADPEWGLARGRAWTSKMAFSRALGGAFLFGEGIHGWVNEANGRYMDDLWLYDVNAHRWVNLYPGTDTRSPPKLQVTRGGFEGVGRDQPIPIATMVHGYEMTAWDPVRQLFFSMPNHHPYYKEPLPSVAAFRERHGSRLNREAASPWMFDPWNRRWHRLRTPTPSPKSAYGHVLFYIPSQQKLFHYRPNRASYYDPGSNTWQRIAPKGPPPAFGIDPTACHDPKRDRLYIGGGAYPTARGDNALWYFDVQSRRWVNPQPAGSAGDNRFGTNVALLACDPGRDRVYLFRHKGVGRGLYIYDAARNAWRDKPVDLPRMWRTTVGANGFFHPGLGVQFVHTANDSRANGRVLVYKPE